MLNNKSKALIVCNNNINACMKASYILSEYYDVLGLLMLSDIADKINESNIKTFEIQELCSVEYDKLLVVSGRLGATSLIETLVQYGVQEEKIDFSYIDALQMMRDSFLQQYSIECDAEGRAGNCAECGVLKGDFAKRINKFFPNRKLYLFDFFYEISENKLLNKMPYPNQCKVFAGDFLETSQIVKDNFCYVHLDFHAAPPTEYALTYFLGKMSPGGIIAIHDYYSPTLGVREVVDDFLKNNPSLTKITMSGGSAIAIVGF